MTKETNKEFCEAWVRKCWIPSIEPLRQAVSIKRAVAFRPITVINDEHAEVLEVALSAVHRLYIRLLKNSKVEKAIVRDLVVLRSELGPLRFSLCRYFAQLAGSVEGLAKEDEHQGLPLLPKDAQVFRDILVAAGPHEPILGPKLCDEYLKRTNEAVDESAFRTRIAPVLEAWGMRNQPRIGYYFPESAAARRRR